MTFARSGGLSLMRAGARLSIGAQRERELQESRESWIPLLIILVLLPVVVLALMLLALADWVLARLRLRKDLRSP